MVTGEKWLNIKACVMRLSKSDLDRRIAQGLLAGAIFGIKIKITLGSWVQYQLLGSYFTI